MIALPFLKTYPLCCTMPVKPPMINGVSASQVYLPTTYQYATIYEFLCDTFKHICAQEWQQRIVNHLVLDATLTPITLQQPYVGNQHLFYYRFLPKEIHVPFAHQILFENNALMVVDKPHFLTISPTGQYIQETLLVRLKHQTQNEDLTPIHRLDRETAGVVLFCKKPEYRAIYQQLFAQHQIKKTYHAIAPYNSTITFPKTIKNYMCKGEPFYTMTIADGEPNSETYIQILEYNQHFAKYELFPKTGKQHQLRVHLNTLGIPIKNDSFYPHVLHKPDHEFEHPLQLLAKKIEFTDPLTQELMSFSSHYNLTL